MRSATQVPAEIANQSSYLAVRFSRLARTASTWLGAPSNPTWIDASKASDFASEMPKPSPNSIDEIRIRRRDIVLLGDPHRRREVEDHDRAVRSEDQLRGTGTDEAGESRIGRRVLRQSRHRGGMLRFSGEVESEGGGGAVIEAAPGERVYGGIYAISHDQIAAMDAVELDSAMNTNLRGIRRTVAVDADGARTRAEIYEVPQPSIYRAPSAIYLGHITKGLRDFGYGDDVIAAVEAIAASEPKDAS